MKQSVLQLSVAQNNQTFVWEGAPRDVFQTEAEVRRLLQNLQTPLYALNINGNVVLEDGGRLAAVDEDGIGCLGVVNALEPMNLGNTGFCQAYNTRYPYYAGAMANGINSVAMVIALGQAGILSSFGAGGLSAERVGEAIDQLNQALPDKRYAINLLHNPGHPSWEMDCVEHCINKGVKLVEASAYINLSTALVYYRVAGLRQQDDGSVVSDHKIIAKVSRGEVAQNFLLPAPEKLLAKLHKAGLINEQQIAMAKMVPMADDITVESDSGGHTDHGVLSCIFPEITALRNRIYEQQNYPQRPRVGAAGGIGSPEGAWAAFAMGADFIVTGSINQACEESGTSQHARTLLKAAGVADVVSAPSADMFELGAKVQVLKASSMYGVRAQKLYSLYKQYDSLNALPEKETAVLEKTVFGQPLANVWADTKAFFESRGMQDMIDKAEANAKKQMALVFQWYLGQSSKWAIDGNDERKLDYQIWCGPAMGTCNDWLKGSALEHTRSVVAIAENIMFGAAYLARVSVLKNLGITVPQSLAKSPVLSINKIKELMGKARYSFNTTPSSEHHGNTTQPLQGNTAMSMDTEATTKLDLKESKAYYKKTWNLLPGGAHYNFADPERPLVIPFNKGRGSRVWDLDGNEHLDLFAKFGAMFVGHNNPDYMTALRKYMDKVTSVDTCDLEYDVCSMLSSHIPSAEMVRFALSGTEAVQNALRLARAYTGKNRFIRFQGHYHGNADNVMGGRKAQDQSWPVPEMYRGDLMDTKGRADGILQEQSFILPWNDIAALDNALRNFGDQIAAVLMEPICMNGGGILPRAGYLQQAKELCERHNVVLIFDEVITGVRVGLGGAQKLLGVTPHLSVFAKALGGGSMPISLIAGQKDLMNLYTKGGVIHAGTFNGYPLGLAAIQATYEIVENDPGCYERMGGLMGQISKLFVRAAVDVGMEMVVQGMPTALVYHSQGQLVDRSEGYTDKTKFGDVIIREVSKRFGLQFSPLSRLYPNLMLNETDVEFFGDRIHDSLTEAKKMIDLAFKEEASA